MLELAYFYYISGWIHWWHKLTLVTSWPCRLWIYDLHLILWSNSVKFLTLALPPWGTWIPCRFKLILNKLDLKDLSVTLTYFWNKYYGFDLGNLGVTFSHLRVHILWPNHESWVFCVGCSCFVSVVKGWVCGTTTCWHKTKAIIRTFFHVFVRYVRILAF
jgi:hypothetical protein